VEIRKKKNAHIYLSFSKQKKTSSIHKLITNVALNFENNN